MEQERLIGVAIMRGDKLMTMREGSHAQLREYKDREPLDVEGFMTSENRFVGRGVAHLIGLESGQVQQSGRELLSSDVTWNSKPKAPPRKHSASKPKGKRWPNKRKLF